MTLIKCPDCENKISPRALTCPVCGCPAEFFVLLDDKESNIVENKEIKSEIDEETVNFNLAGICLEYKKNASEFAKLFGMYLSMADKAYREMLLMYDEAGTISNVLQKCPSKAKQIIDGVINESTKYLYKIKIYYSIQQFKEKYGKNYDFDYDSVIEEIQDSFDRILYKKNQLALQRETEKAGRGRWQGGGFGVKGAIKGAVTASIMNAGSDILHSFGDAAKVGRDNEIIETDLQALYRQDKSKNYICYSVYIIIMNIYKAMSDTLIQSGYFESTIPLDENKAKAIYEATREYETDSEEIVKKMVQCISLYPGQRRFYEKIYDNLIDSGSDFTAFLKFWNIEFMFSDIEKKYESVSVFREFAKEYALQEFDFTDTSVINAIKLRRIIHEYQVRFNQQLPKDGEYSARIENYYKTFSLSNREVNYKILDWMPADATIEQFIKSLKDDERYFTGSLTRAIWTLGDYDCEDEDAEDERDRVNIFEGSYPSMKTKKKLRENGAQILFYYDCSIFKNGSKGFAVTTQYFWDLKSQVRIALSDIVDIKKVPIKDKFGLQVRSEKQEITFVDSAYVFQEDERGIAHFAKQLKVMLVRFFLNSNVWCEEMLTARPIADEKNKELLQDLEKKQIENDIESYILCNFDRSSKVKAIQYYRACTGTGLKEATDKINEIFDKNIDRSPAFQMNSQKKNEIFCTNCGKQIMSTAKFCNFCGEKNNYNGG